MTAPVPDDVMLAVRGLEVRFHGEEGVAHAVNGVDLTIRRGETLALVGESGSGKSVMSLATMGLIPTPPGRLTAGEILVRRRDGSVVDMRTAPERVKRTIRGNEISMIFQEPMTSLNPVYPVGDQIAESVMLHKGVSKAAAWKRAEEMLDVVGIPDPHRRVQEYPHQMSGGMRQRVMIAMALACDPSLVIADEPTTALDVTIQAQILDLMRRLQRDFGMSILFITHNLGVVCDVADRVAVMYGGRIVETAETRTLFKAPGHPYTRGLLASVPRLEEGESGYGRRLYAIPGTVPSPLIRQTGCTFASRCDRVIEACHTAVPPLEDVSSGKGLPPHSLRCIRWRDADVAAAVR